MSTTKSGSRKAHRRARSRRRAPGRSLGLGDSSTVKLIRKVRQGFPFTCLQRLQKNTDLPWDRVAEFVQISRRTLSRRETEGRLSPEESDRVLRASRVFDAVVELFEGDVEAARKWLQTPQPGLGGETPLDFASTEVGSREVEQLIERLEHGVFV